MDKCPRCDRPSDMYSKTGLCTYHLLKEENKESLHRKEVFFRTWAMTFCSILAILTLIAAVRITPLATITSYFYILYISTLAIGSLYATFYYHKQQQ